MLHPHPPHPLPPGALPATRPTVLASDQPSVLPPSAPSNADATAATAASTAPARVLDPPRAASAAPLRGATAGPGVAAAEFLAVFERQLSQCRRYGQPMVVLAVCIEQVAALEGAAAEGLQAAVSHELWNRLRARTRAKDTVLRLSELEYAVLLPGCRVPSAAGACARLAAALGGVYALGPGPVLATVSLGLANLGADGDTATLLWQAAVRSRAAAPMAAGAAATPARRHEQAAAARSDR